MAKRMPADLGQVVRLAPVSLTPPPTVAAPPAAVDRGAKQRRVRLEQICANPGQLRRRFNGEEIEALADSIAEHGLIQPIVVRRTGSQQYEIVAGERRLLALQRLQLHGRLPQGGVPVLVHEHMSDDDLLVRAYVENAHRAELNPVEDAEALGRILEQRERVKGRRPTVRELADLLPPGKTVIAEAIKIYNALQDPELEALVRNADKLGKSLLLRVLDVTDIAARCELLRLAGDGATPQEVQAQLTKMMTRSKPGRPKQVLTRTKRSDGSYDLALRVRPDMGREEPERALKALEEVIEDLQTRLEVAAHG